jgi:hypothetical protein
MYSEPALKHTTCRPPLTSNQLFPKLETKKKAVMSVLQSSAEEKQNSNGKKKKDN